LSHSGLIVNLDQPDSSLKATLDDLVLRANAWSQLANRLIQETEAYHRSNPLRRGLPREELKSRLRDLTRSSPRLFNLALRRLVQQNELLESGPLVMRPGFSLRLNPQQERLAQQLLQRFAAAPFSPPSVKECLSEVGEDLFAALLELDRLVQVSPEVVFRKEDYERLLADLRSLFAQHTTLTVAQVRDHFNTSRRYILALLEHLDALGITIRDGDTRRLRK
jgi:selenocysteine-specific elongation factor